MDKIKILNKKTNNHTNIHDINRNKEDKFYTKSSFAPTTAEKDSKKIIKKINCLFYNKRHQ